MFMTNKQILFLRILQFYMDCLP